MNKTKIEWCDSTLNPVVGCTYGCPYCYARKMNSRFAWIEDWNKPQFFAERIEQLKNKKPQNIFMNSMSDIADWRDEWIEQTFLAMNENKQHNYLFLTKRPEKLREIFEPRYIPSNWWFGTTVTDNDNYINRSCELYNANNRNVNPIKKFLSIEPLQGKINDWTLFSTVHLIDWIIIGAETGNRKDKIIPKKEWIDNIVEICKEKNTPVFMKDSLISIIGEENMLREFPQGLSWN